MLRRETKESLPGRSGTIWCGGRKAEIGRGCSGLQQQCGWPACWKRGPKRRPQKPMRRTISNHGGQGLDTDRIERWMQEEGYDNRELAEKLHISRRVVSSMRNNRKHHGRHAIEKLAKLMGLDEQVRSLPGVIQPSPDFRGMVP